MKIKIYPIFLIFIFLITFFIFYKGLKNSNIYKPNVNVQKDIPEFQAKNFENNKIINSKDIFLDDKFYLLNIWASWCAPCREEHKFLMNLNEEKIIDIIGLNYKDDHQKAKKFLNDLKSPYMIILKDLDGTVAIEWGAYGVPETFLIYNKKVLKKIIGPLNENSVLEIKEIIK